MQILRLGTRASVLATAQTTLVQEMLRNKLSLETCQVPIRTNAAYRSDGSFVAALRTALAQGKCDLAVHSLKDVPIAQHDDVFIAAVLKREDPRDALCSKKHLALKDLPGGACVGTASARRRAQILNIRPDLNVVEIRGNIDTRLAQLDSLDAVVLSVAGLKRIGREDAISEIFEIAQWPTAAGQGSLAIEVRRPQNPDDVPCAQTARNGAEKLVRSLEKVKTASEGFVVGGEINTTLVAIEIDNYIAHLETMTEKHVLRVLHADCFSPIAVNAFYSANKRALELRAKAFSPDGQKVCESVRTVQIDTVQINSKTFEETKDLHLIKSLDVHEEDLLNAIKVAQNLAEAVTDDLLSQNIREVIQDNNATYRQ